MVATAGREAASTSGADGRWQAVVIPPPAGGPYEVIVDGGPQRLQFILTDERVHVVGDVAWVTVDENLISDEVSATVAAVNVFRRDGDRWQMVLHHGSPVAPAGR